MDPLRRRNVDDDTPPPLAPPIQNPGPPRRAAAAAAGPQQHPLRRRLRRFILLTNLLKRPVINLIFALVMLSFIAYSGGWYLSQLVPAYRYLTPSASSKKYDLEVKKLTQADMEVDPTKGSGSGVVGEVRGHWDFDDGRKWTTREEFLKPESKALNWVNVMLGNGGPEPNLSGGMIPAVAPPFGMTRWSPQTRENYVSMCPYNQTDTKFHGFIGTHQPAIWMGESGPAQISGGLGQVVTDFEARGLPFSREDEYASANYYRNLLDAGKEGKIEVEMTASSRVGHMRYTFDRSQEGGSPHVVVQASRRSWILHGDQPDAKVPYFPKGFIQIDEGRQEVYGWNDERQDHVLVGEELPAHNFKAYFVARFSQPWRAAGVSYEGKVKKGVLSGEGEVLAGWVQFGEDVKQVEVRLGVSFISVEQARRNIDLEIPDSQTLVETSQQTRSAWSEKLDLLSVSGATPQNLTVLYSSFAHTLVYPYEISENTGTSSSPSWSYYSGYLDEVVSGISYSGYSIWDTFRAQTAWLLLVAPERVGAMITSMLQDYKEGGWLPMWKNLVETNIMVGTHADSIIAQAMNAGVKDFDWDLAWEAVKKDAFVPPDRDTELQFGDREEGTPQEVRAGLTEYMKLGYVAADLHEESGSRTLDYAYDDHAAAMVADHVGDHDTAKFLRFRAGNYKTLWNRQTGHMEARNSDGSWAGYERGWTEGDHWAYSLDVMHDVPGLIELMGGNASFIDFLDRHFEGGHNLHTNEPSHHIPYLYIFAGAPHKSQEWVRSLGRSEYNHTAGGLSGNEDCGQMSAWYMFSALGFYPVDPAKASYVLSSPYFDQITLRLPNTTKPLIINARGASHGSVYVMGLKINDQVWTGIEVDHATLIQGGKWDWDLESTPQVRGV
ncbi:hypothetical protein CI109_101423 [Kwoniella shandongensis]|uniref:Uncharacterized protein n=1 Tax=Kwoniella shandongensis TaxID=1734106 RepID=A0A5M6BUX4_9TREE|nr:uncharacterized protein CI109_005119 [Kwoniella shandongensis]KAA5526543.1 hypothetical protein CI109_005119 [Kwoniella shandongensis]